MGGLAPFPRWVLSAAEAAPLTICLLVKAVPVVQHARNLSYCSAPCAVHSAVYSLRGRQAERQRTLDTQQQSTHLIMQYVNIFMHFMVFCGVGGAHSHLECPEDVVRSVVLGQLPLQGGDLACINRGNARTTLRTALS